jgi:hypothetical protein
VLFGRGGNYAPALINDKRTRPASADVNAQYEDSQSPWR